jgi:hypothetical protein
MTLMINLLSFLLFIGNIDDIAKGVLVKSLRA